MTRRARPPGGTHRGLDLAYQHCASLDFDTPRARERLERKLGASHACLLVEALCARPAVRHGSSLRLAG